MTLSFEVRDNRSPSSASWHTEGDERHRVHHEDSSATNCPESWPATAKPVAEGDARAHGRSRGDAAGCASVSPTRCGLARALPPRVSRNIDLDMSAAVTSDLMNHWA